MTLNTRLDAATVLVVEDEALILMGTIMTIEDAGYVVVGATNAEEAREALARYPQIAVMITDIHLRGSTMDGVALAHEVHRLSPVIEILVVSGIARPRANELPDGARFLEKPYTSRQITESLDAMLKSPAN